MSVSNTYSIVVTASICTILRTAAHRLSDRTPSSVKSYLVAKPERHLILLSASPLTIYCTEFVTRISADGGFPSRRIISPASSTYRNHFSRSTDRKTIPQARIAFPPLARGGEDYYYMRARNLNVLPYGWIQQNHATLHNA